MHAAYKEMEYMYVPKHMTFQEEENLRPCWPDSRQLSL